MGSPASKAAARERFIVQGQVQGVGFRPFVFTLAEEFGLCGFVQNTSRGVVIEVQGNASALAAFAEALATRLPPLAVVTNVERTPLPALPEPSDAALPERPEVALPDRPDAALPDRPDASLPSMNAPRYAENTFSIAESLGGQSHSVLISPDTATCDACLHDMTHGRRKDYPFTNCTNCGPRYTITRSIPYDRAYTSMACFPMCKRCREEYENPRDRRFHAQPNACPECGPTLWLEKAQGDSPVDIPASNLSGIGASPAAQPGNNTRRPAYAEATVFGDAALDETARLLASGSILALKGLGGFHLACNACDKEAVALLRERKKRPHKPFAIMVANAADARRFVHIEKTDEALLLSPERPIVILPATPEGRHVLAPGLSPDTGGIGVMLPYTPLHHVLFERYAKYLGTKHTLTPAVLVMTSGNPGGEPICLSNREAKRHLAGMADAFLFHDRDILIRVDDSVIRPTRSLPDEDDRHAHTAPLVLRRARGYVPRPLPLPCAAPADSANSLPSVLGTGAELKNTLCLTRGNEAFVSQHIGDMENLETSAFHEAMRDHLCGLLQTRPAAVVRDLHPDYLAGQVALEYAKAHAVPLFTLQHHFAHAHAVLAENNFCGKALVLALDGTGFGGGLSPEQGGDDTTAATLWGGELLYLNTGTADAEACEGAEKALRILNEPGPADSKKTERAGNALFSHTRLATLAPLPLPGGAAAIKEPWRIAHALLLRLGLYEEAQPHITWLREHQQAAAFLPSMLEKGINTPFSTSCGRLFDAVSALLGLCPVASYEGQAAIRLEEAQFPEHAAYTGQAAPGTAFHGAAFHGALPSDALYPCPLLPAPQEAAPGQALHGRSPKDLGLRFPARMDSHALFTALCKDWFTGVAIHEIAARFHYSLAAALAENAAVFAKALGVTAIGLSGGCLNNATLTNALCRELRARSLTPLTHSALPPGDGCISYGQAAYGARLLCALSGTRGTK